MMYFKISHSHCQPKKKIYLSCTKCAQLDFINIKFFIFINFFKKSYNGSIPLFLSYWIFNFFFHLIWIHQLILNLYHFPLVELLLITNKILHENVNQLIKNKNLSISQILYAASILSSAYWLINYTLNFIYTNDRG